MSWSLTYMSVIVTFIKISDSHARVLHDSFLTRLWRQKFNKNSIPAQNSALLYDKAAERIQLKILYEMAKNTAALRSNFHLIARKCLAMCSQQSRKATFLCSLNWSFLWEVPACVHRSLKVFNTVNKTDDFLFFSTEPQELKVCSWRSIFLKRPLSCFSSTCISS